MLRKIFLDPVLLMCVILIFGSAALAWKATGKNWDVFASVSIGLLALFLAIVRIAEHDE